MRSRSTVLVCAYLLLALVGQSAEPSAAPEVARGPLGRKLDDYLSRLEKFGFSGAVIVARNGEVVLSKGYGLADRERNLPFTPQTVSSTGSITKQFTAAAILKLEMQGKLKVEDSISKYFADVPENKKAITLHHLLTHTAGFRGDFGGRDDDPIERDALVRRVLETPLEAAPGERYEYSNEGYSLLGAIVEIVSGMPYEEFLSKNLFGPARMTRTGYLKPDWASATVAMGYSDEGRWGTILRRGWREDGPGWYLRANGGIHSTAEDMYRWHRALEGDQILSAEVKKKLFAPHVAEDPSGRSHYGYGWAISTTPRGTRLVAHNGGNGIFAADFLRFVDEGVVIYVHTNAPLMAYDFSSDLAALAFGEPVEPPPAVTALDPKALARFAGTYEFPSGERFSLQARGGQLQVADIPGALFARLMDLQSPGAPPLASTAERTRRLIEEGSRGNYEGIHQLFGGRMPLAEIEAEEGRIWKMRRDQFGEFKAVELLGAADRGPAVVVYVRMTFERQVRIARYIWRGEEFLGVRPGGGPETARFLPTGPTEFAAFTLRPRATVRLSFEVKKDGRVAGLAFTSGKATVTARPVAPTN